MKYTKTIVITVIVLLLTSNLRLFGQTYFSENFEGGTTPLNWSNQFIDGSTLWRYAYGGFRTVDTLPNSANPPATPDGSNYNALFQVQEIGSSTMLVTPKINTMEYAIKPELRFYHAQYAWYHGFYGIDNLSVYYKNNVDSAWVLLKEYPNEVNSWEYRKILLPDSTLSKTYYIGFKATSNWGYGVCIDNVQIIETGIQPRAVESVKYSQPYTQPIPSGTSNNPLLRMDVTVSGNTGKMIFKSLEVKSIGTNDNDIADKGLHLYLTQDTLFNTENYIGEVDSIKNHIAFFNNLNYEMESGTTHLWLTADADSSAGHNDIMDFSLQPGKLRFILDTTGIMNITGIIGVVNDSIVYTKEENTLKAPLYYNLPKNEVSPIGKRIIRETVFVDDFETDKGWHLRGEFQIDTARGLGGKAGYGKGNPDPKSAVSGSRVLGTDLSGMGYYPGNYEILDPGNPGDSVLLYQAISPSFNLKFYNDVKILFYKYLNAESTDHAGIDISVDGGSTWQNIYNKSGQYYNNSWVLDSFDISQYASRQRDVKIRFTLGPTDDLGQYSGWNIDDFVVTANYLTSDLGVTELLTPVNGCGHTGSETVQIKVKNYSALQADTIPVSISLNGGASFIHDTIYHTIKSDSSAILTLNKTLDLTTPGIYNFIATTSAAKDEDHTNDTATVKLYIQPTITLPSEENFETSSGIWMPYGKNSTWQWGRSYQGDYPPPSGTKVWRTGLDRNYKSNDSSFIESPCYNFNDTTRYLLKVYHWNSTESLERWFKHSVLTG